MLAILSAVVLAVALCSIPVAAQPPVAPTGEAISSFYGTVTIGGSPAPDGLTVSAKVEGVEYDTAITVDGSYGRGPQEEHMLKIPADDPATPQKDGGLNGDTVEFFVEGVKTNNEPAIFESMTYSMLNLTVPAFIPAAQPEGEEDQEAEAEAAGGEDDGEAAAAQVQGQEDGEAEVAQVQGQDDGEAAAAQPEGEEHGGTAGGEGGWAWWMTIIMIPAIILVAAIPAIILDRRRRARAR